MTDVSPMTRGLLLAFVAATAVACHRVEARLPTPQVVLNVPSAPSPVLIPVKLPAVEEPPPAPPPPAPPVTPAPSRPTAANPPPDRTPTVAAPPPVTEAPSPVLQTTADANAIEPKIRAKLQAAERDLERVRYNELSASAKEQYLAAKGHVQTANSALKIKNYLYAEYLADKAAVLLSYLTPKR